MRLALLTAVIAMAGCSSSGPTATNLPAAPKNDADKERLIRENTQLTPEQKERELARLRASSG